MIATLVILALFVLILVFLPQIREARRKPMDAAARRGMPGQLADLSLGQTHYQWLGSVRGPIIVCVHGLTTPSFVWRTLGAGFGQLGYRVLIYDLYGRGYSDRPKGKQTPEVFSRQLEDLLEHEEITQDFTLVGYSMGGAIATTYAAQHPSRIRQLILLAPAGVHVRIDKVTAYIAKSRIIGTWLMGVLFPHTHRGGISTEQKTVTAEFPEVFDLQRQELQYKGFVRSVLSSIRGLLGRSFEEEHRTLFRHDVPVLAVWGRHDDVIPIEALGLMAMWNRDAVQEVVEEGGHGLPYTHSTIILDTLAETLRDGLK